MAATNNTDDFEPDRFSGAPHPRERHVLIGHDAAEEAFLEGLRSGRLHHAWLIGGPMGIGKATLAYRVARALLQQTSAQAEINLDMSPDDLVFRQVIALSHPDLAVLRRSSGTEKKAASSTIPVELVRKALALFESTAATSGYRVCIVDSAEDLTTSSANALLKLVEEPPPRSIFLIVSHSPQRVLPTIRSRCRKLSLRPLTDEAVRNVVSSLGTPWKAVGSDLLDEAIRLGEGSVRRTLEMLSEDRIVLARTIAQILDRLPQKSDKAVLALAETLSKRDAEDAYELALDLVNHWISKRIETFVSTTSSSSQSLASRLAPLAAVSEKLSRSAIEADIFNLDRRPLILGLFEDLADAVRS